jgi:hypothetical protein
MWVNRDLFQMVLDDNKKTTVERALTQGRIEIIQMRNEDLRSQIAKNDMTIDWMRHRINALEKERTVLVMKVAGIALPTPEIVATRPGTLSGTPEMHIPASMEDPGDSEALRLGISHADDGTLVYKG